MTKIISGYTHGAEGVSADKLTGNYCRGEFEATAIVDRLAEYEAIGTVDECRAAVEKQKALKPMEVLGISGYKEYECKECGDILSGIESYCSSCGQKLDWESEGEDE